MIHVNHYQELGHRNFGWLNAHYHFSFGDYYNPKRSGFGLLRVINDDVVEPGKGFPAHAHDNMEIITYVRNGAITHKDSTGNTGRTSAGDVQVMSAGTGINHSEYNMEQEPTTLYQIWIEPHTQNVTPRWDAAAFPKDPVKDSLRLLVSGRSKDKGSNALFIYQDAAIYGGNITKNTSLSHSLGSKAYLLVSEGEITANDQILCKGDGAEVTNESVLNLHANTNSEVLLIELPE
jgi:redox-sensitive bicupin YhaK (pirin superfamily)